MAVKIADDDIMEIAKHCVQGGAMILLPFDAGDAPVSFRSRWELRYKIAAAMQRERDRCLRLCAEDDSVAGARIAAEIRDGDIT